MAALVCLWSWQLRRPFLPFYCDFLYRSLQFQWSDELVVQLCNFCRAMGGEKVWLWHDVALHLWLWHSDQLFPAQEKAQRQVWTGTPILHYTILYHIKTKLNWTSLKCSNVQQSSVPVLTNALEVEAYLSHNTLESCASRKWRIVLRVECASRSQNFSKNYSPLHFP